MLIAVFNDNVILREFDGASVRLIDGKVRNKSECCGFCNCERHKGCLTARQMEEHKCKEKGCHHLFNMVNPYKEAMKQERKEKRRSKQNEERLFLKLCQESIIDMEGIKVVSVNIQGGNVVTVEYISICSVDERLLIDAIEGCMKGFIVRLVYRDVGFDRAVEMIYGGEAA